MSPQLKRAASQYKNNVQTYAKDHAKAQYRRLRETVIQNALDGHKYDTLIQRLQRELSVSNAKAAFIAKQETSNFVAQYHRTLYPEYGVTHYRWNARPTAREDHRVLNGRVFRYDTPPIVDRSTGRRGNPGEDFGPCQCWDTAILGTPDL